MQYEIRSEDGYSENFEAADDESAARAALAIMSRADFDLSAGTVSSPDIQVTDEGAL